MSKDPRRFTRWSDKLLSPREEEVLNIIFKWPGVIQSEIVECTGFCRATVRNILRKLCEMNLVEARKLYIVDGAGQKHASKGFYSRTAD